MCGKTGGAVEGGLGSVKGEKSTGFTARKAVIDGREKAVMYERR